MGFKIILLISIVLITGLFTVQNAQNITLVFLGFNSLNLPLSLWMILAVLAGILSSFIIQLLSSSSSQKNSNYYSPPESDNNPPPPPSQKQKSSFKKQPDNQVFSQPLPVENNLKYHNPDEELDSDFDFDFEEDSTPEKPLTYNQENRNNFEQSPDFLDADFDFQEDLPSENIPFQEDLPLESVPEVKPIVNEQNQEIPTKITPPIPEKLPEESVPLETKEIINSNDDNIPSETFLKAREASLYSYKPGEKTEITPKSTKIKTSQKNDEISSIERSKSSENRYSGGVYDAPYRVISPSDDYDEQLSSEDDEFFDEDEDWDF